MRPGRSCPPELRPPAAFVDHPPSVCTSGEMVAADTLPGGSLCGGPRGWARGPPRSPAIHARRNVLQYGGGSRRVLGLMFEAILARGSMAPILPIHCGTGKIRLAARISEKLRALSETAAGLGNWPAALAEAAMPRHMFADTLRPPTRARMTGQRHQMRQRRQWRCAAMKLGQPGSACSVGGDESCCPLLTFRSVERS